MGGFMGIGGSSAKTDRGAELGARQGLWNVFNWALPEGQKQEAAGQATLSGSLKPVQQAQDYFSKLLTAGRTETATNAAPAVNAAMAGGDTARRAGAAFGTSRVGGAAAGQREAGSATTKTIDDIINQNLVGGRQAGAAGLTATGQVEAGIGEAQLKNALSLLGLSEDAVKSIMGQAAESRKTSQNINRQTQAQWGDVIGALLGAG